MGRQSLLLVLTGVIVLLGTSTAGAQSRQDYEGRFTTPTPGVSSGYDFSIAYRDPADPEGKPPAVATIVQELHEGTRIDTSVPPRCTASDPQLLAQGTAACPAATRVGGGVLEADTGTEGGPLPRVLVNEVTFFNADGELILFTQATNANGLPVRTSSRVPVGPRSFTSSVPPLPTSASSDPFLAIRRVTGQLDAITAGDRAFIRTPPTCPASRAWTNVGTFTYRDGVMQSDAGSSPCTPTAPQTAAPGAAPPAAAAPGRRRSVLVVSRRSASSRFMNRRRAIGIALRVDGRLTSLRARMVRVGSSRTVAGADLARVTRDRTLVLRRRSSVRPGRYRVIVTARTALGRVIRATRTVRLR